MVASYKRYSTHKQDEQEQTVIINRWCEQHSVKIDKEYIDRGISGKVDFENRNLAQLVNDLKEGDTIIVSEASRLSRSMADFSKFVNVTIRKKKARIVIINVNLDIDCSNFTSVTELMLSMLSFASQFERELISSRTKAGLKARKLTAEAEGGWTSKAGNWCDHLGRKKGEKLGEREKMTKHRSRIELRIPETTVKIVELRRMGFSVNQIAAKLNEMGLLTEQGKVWHTSKVSRIVKLYSNEINR